MNEKPLVSIIIPVYNGGNYLHEAIESALAQTYTNIEIIVVNDGSCDNGQTEKVALSYGDMIRYFVKENGGVSSALNLGISQMKGDYFSWLSHDDKYTPNKIEHQVRLIQKYKKQRVIALCESQFINEQSEIMRHQRANRFRIGKIEWREGLADMFQHGTYNGCAFLIPKKYFDECGLFDERLRFAQDTLMWAKILFSQCSIVYNSDKDVLSRVHEAQQTHKMRYLLDHDGLVIAEYIVPRLLETDNKRSVYLLAKRNAKLNNQSVLKFCIEKGKIKGLKLLFLHVFGVYGKIRPMFRKIYYRLFRKIKTT